MDLKHLRILVTAIEEGSIQAASRQLNIAQPALSRRLRDLEIELGCELLVRGGRGVVPTPAGQALYRDAIAILASVLQAAQRAQRLGLEQNRDVRLGLVMTSRRYPFLQEALSTFGQHGGSAGIALHRAFSRDNATALRKGELDATLLFERRIGSGPYGERLIHKERYVVAAHPQHPLARPGPLRLAELAGVPLVCVLRDDMVNQHNPLVQHCRLQGLDPVIGQWAASPDEMLDLVSISGGICITPASAIISTPPGQLAFRLIEDFTLELELRLAWLDPPSTPAVQGVLSALDSAIERHRQSIHTGDKAWAVLDGLPLYRAD